MRLSFKTRTTLCTVFIALSAWNADAQKQAQDIINILQKELVADSIQNRQDTGKINTLDSLSYEYWYVDPDKGIAYGLQGLALAKKIGFKKAEARSNSYLGGNYENKSDYTNALKYEYAALNWYETTGDTREEIIMLCNVGIVYRNKGEPFEALRYDSIALKKNESINDTGNKALILANMGNVYHSQKDYTKALLYCHKALQLDELLGNKEHAAINLCNIGNVYADLGKQGEAIKYYFKALKIDEEAGNKGGMALNMGNMGETYLEIAKDTTGNIHADSFVHAGRTENLNTAIDYLKKTVELCTQIGRLDYVIEYASSLSEAYILSGNYKDGFLSYKQFITTRDSVDNVAKDKEFTHRKLDYEYGKREDAIRYEKKLNDERYIAGIVVLVLFSFFVYRNSRLQKRANVVISKEKKRSDDLLLNILPTEVANELMDSGKAAAKHFDNVTVLFTDFVGFTHAGERMSPQQLVDELHTCFKAFDEIMGKYNIEKIKTIGDAYLAVAGLPQADPKHAIHVVNAAMEIRDFMLQRYEQAGDKTFQVRLGIHSGNVVAGIVGVKKFAYDIWGDTVNTAARMEQNSEAGRINISQTTYELVKDEFACTYRGEIAAKNKGLMKMYFVDGVLL